MPEASKFIKRETLAQMVFCEFCEIFKNTFFTEQIRFSTSDIRIQVVVISNLSLQFVTINFSFSLLRVFTLAHASMLPTSIFYIDLFSGRVISSHSSQDHSWRKITAKHNIQKTLIHGFHNRLLGEVTIILELLLNFSHSVRIVLGPTL